MSTAFDTLAATKQLREAGLAERQAEATAIKDGQGESATKSDVACLAALVEEARPIMDLAELVPFDTSRPVRHGRSAELGSSGWQTSKRAIRHRSENSPCPASAKPAVRTRNPTIQCRGTR